MIIEVDKILTALGTLVSPIFTVFEFKFNVCSFVVLLPILIVFIAVLETVFILSVSVALIGSIEFSLTPPENVSSAVAMSVSVFIRYLASVSFLVSVALTSSKNSGLKSIPSK